MIKRSVVAIVALASTIAAAYALFMLDQIVHDSLYNYGLQFSYEWANPYWMLLRITQILLATTAAASTVSLALALRGRAHTVRATSTSKVMSKAPASTRRVETEQPPSATSQPLPQSKTTFHGRPASQKRNSEPTPKPQPSTKPTPATPSHSSTHSDDNSFISCPKCRKSFRQPLRILDFQGEKPRLVDTCPFCGETLPHSARSEGVEQEENNAFSNTESNHNHRKTTTN